MIFAHYINYNEGSELSNFKKTFMKYNRELTLSVNNITINIINSICCCHISVTLNQYNSVRIFFLLEKQYKKKNKFSNKKFPRCKWDLVDQLS